MLTHSAFQGELLILYPAVQTFHTELSLVPSFCIISDCKSLIYLSLKRPNALQAKVILLLSELQDRMKRVHKPGRINIAADYHARYTREREKIEDSNPDADLWLLPVDKVTKQDRTIDFPSAVRAADPSPADVQSHEILPNDALRRLQNPALDSQAPDSPVTSQLPGQRFERIGQPTGTLPCHLPPVRISTADADSRYSRALTFSLTTNSISTKR